MAYNKYSEITDSHMSKRFNDLLIYYLGVVSMYGESSEKEPHYVYVKSYFSALFTLYRRVFMLFGDLTVKNGQVYIMDLLKQKIADAKGGLELMETNPKYRTLENLKRVVDICHSVDMLISYAMQRRQMFVRLGTNEPKGRDSIAFWENKTGFMKGGISQDAIVTNSKGIQQIGTGKPTIVAGTELMVKGIGGSGIKQNLLCSQPGTRPANWEGVLR